MNEIEIDGSKVETYEHILKSFRRECGRLEDQSRNDLARLKKSEGAKKDYFEGAAAARAQTLRWVGNCIEELMVAIDSQ